MPNTNQQAIDVAKTLRTYQHVLLCNQLKQARIDAKLTQADLAQHLDKPQSYLAKVETQERRIDVVEYVRWMVSCENTDLAMQTIRDIAATIENEDFNKSKR